MCGFCFRDKRREEVSLKLCLLSVPAAWVSVTAATSLRSGWRRSPSSPASVLTSTPQPTNVSLQTRWQRQPVMALILYTLEIRGEWIVLIPFFRLTRLCLLPSLSLLSSYIPLTYTSVCPTQHPRVINLLNILCMRRKGGGRSLKFNRKHTMEA